MIENIKEKFIEKGKPLAIAAVCFLAVFIAGFGTGRISDGNATSTAQKRSLSNYTTNTGDKTKASSSNTNVSAKSVAPIDPSECNIKGSKSKIYHMPGGSFYDRTNPAACFNSEEEAQAAGYTKSSR